MSKASPTRCDGRFAAVESERPRSSLPRTVLAAAVAAVALGMASSPLLWAQDRASGTAEQARDTSRPLADRKSPHAGMLRYPDVSASHIVFSYANDLWVVDREGGVARPLASPPGPELFPKFSPDGSKIAFVGNYEGSRDIYVMDSFGGVPKRITYHPGGPVLADWVDDETLLFAASGRSTRPVARQTSQLYTINIFGEGENGPLPTELPVPYGARASISEDGRTLVYTPHTTDTRTWKRYRGGMATNIWLFDLQDHEFQQVTEWEGTDTAPMLHGGRIYYLSDQTDSHRLNLFVFDPESGERRQLTDFDEWDVKFPSMGPGPDGQGEIVFQYASGLYLLDLGTEEVNRVEIQVPGATPLLADRIVNAAQFIQGSNISPTGKRVLFEARGDIWSLPAEQGHPRQITSTDDAAERNPSWSPDGRWIAFSSDANGEYNLYLLPADGRDIHAEPTQITFEEERFFQTPQWSPDSKKLLVQDQTGRLMLITLNEEDDEVSAEVKEIERDPWAYGMSPNWAPDSRWIAYHRGDEEGYNTAIWLYNVEDDERTRVTSDFFAASNPVFDRKGEWMYYLSSMDFGGPNYDFMRSTFVYDNVDRIVAVPLRADIKNPLLPKVDEEPIKAVAATPGDRPSEDGARTAARQATDDLAEDEERVKRAFKLDSPIHGRWSGKLSGFAALGSPQDEVEFSLVVFAHADGSYTGRTEAMGQSHDFEEAEFDEASGRFTATGGGDVAATVSGQVDGETLTGTWRVEAMNAGGAMEASKLGPIEMDDLLAAMKPLPEGADDPAEPAVADANGDEEPRRPDRERPDRAAQAGPVKPISIDLEGFEERAILLPLEKGNLRSLAVNDRGHLLFVRPGAGGRGGRGGGEEDADAGSGIRIYDLHADEPKEEAVLAGVGGFTMSADGKKLLVSQRGRWGVINAAKGQTLSKQVPTAGMEKRLAVRDEWRQIVTDAWRRQRDYFYVDNMHGVDWDAVLGQYLPMVDDAASREDVSFIISEMISELNVGHAYYSGGDGESAPNRNVGMLGVDWELASDDDGNKAFRIARIYTGGPHDLDARGPLSQPGLGVSTGDFVLAVNGQLLDTTVEPYAAFIGMAGRPTTLTVSDKPVFDIDNEKQRDVVVTPVGNEGGLRYRHWIEHNRQYVYEKSSGRVGYIYVPNTGVEGQNELFRQFYGQRHMDALVIDERWNGGGQIPTRFIELLNRPRTNYFARRHGRDWPTPSDGHQGPKAMLINGLAGSGGDMLPWLFRENDLGPLIGTRTWGGLVGISGVPPLVDGGYTAVPNFGFYTREGVWSIEGHGVDPDIEVLDNPAEMLDGSDPQLDAAIDHLIHELENGSRYSPPGRPTPPDRSGFGIDPAHR